MDMLSRKPKFTTFYTGGVIENLRTRTLHGTEQKWRTCKMKNKHYWRCYYWFSDHVWFSYGDTKLIQRITNNVCLHFASRLLRINSKARVLDLTNFERVSKSVLLLTLFLLQFN
jgi:hypothetical protein